MEVGGKEGSVKHQAASSGTHECTEPSSAVNLVGLEGLSRGVLTGNFGGGLFSQPLYQAFEETDRVLLALGCRGKDNVVIASKTMPALWRVGSSTGFKQQ